MIYLLTAIGLSPGGSSTVHIYTQTVHRTTQNKQYTEKHNRHKQYMEQHNSLIRKYSKTCLKRTPYIPKTWTNGK